MKVKAFCLMMLVACNWACAQTTAMLPNKTAHLSRKMIVQSSSAQVSLGKVDLVVTPLTHKGNLYHGTYQIKVFLYDYKNEKGTLKMEAPKDSVFNLSKGIPMRFTGKATNIKTGEVKVVTGKATPSTIDRGTVMVSIATDNGLMVFNTSYRFVK
ncbi:MAG: hypothetical protein WCS65_01530 [Verrucomicrobiae bacterium]